MKSAPSSAIATASMRRLMRFMRPMSMLPVICSANVARPSWVAVMRGEDSARLGSTRLLAAVERGQRVHEGFVLQQLVAVVVAEGGAVAQADAGGAGGGLGDQVGIEFDRRSRGASKKSSSSRCSCSCSAVAEIGDVLGRRHQLAVEFVGDGDEVLRGLARGRAVAGQRLRRAGRTAASSASADRRRAERFAASARRCAQLRADSIR